MALDMSDRTLALHLGLVPLPEDVSVEHVPQATQHRHERMLDDAEWDLCEFSLATYLAARANGSSLVALPIFPRRMFAMSLLFVHPGAGLSEPQDLMGRRVGLRSFHTTLCVWGMGDLASVYEVPLDQISWVTSRSDPFPIDRAEAWDVSTLDPGDSLDEAFDRGDLDAVLIPRVPGGVARGTAVPLLPDVEKAVRHYHDTTSVFPIMHTVVARDGVLEERPDLARELVGAFEASKRIGYGFYDDPNWSCLVQSTEALRAERAWLGDDPYPYGLEDNLATIDRLLSYELMLGLVSGEPPSAESLFVAA
jgi:4,5-dihydroxyphthalate decarboxylase